MSRLLTRHKVSRCQVWGGDAISYLRVSQQKTPPTYQHWLGPAVYTLRWALTSNSWSHHMKDVRRLPASRQSLYHSRCQDSALWLSVTLSVHYAGVGCQLRDCGYLVPALTPELYAQAGIQWGGGRLRTQGQPLWHRGGNKIIIIILSFSSTAQPQAGMFVPDKSGCDW